MELNNHSRNSLIRGIRVKYCLPFLLIVCLLILTSCRPPQVSQADITVNIQADGAMQPVNIPAGSTVQQAITAAGITVGNLDRLDPPAYTVLSGGDSVRVQRVREEFETRQVVIPFEHQEQRSELLPAGETRLIQAGQNGLKELTYRRVYEDGVESSSSVVKEVILQPPTPEIVMLGVQTPFAPLLIPGKLAYLSAGNAWLMEDSTANRKPLVTTGDLDGRIFALSPDGSWLLFTRKSTKSLQEEKNTLWVINTVSQTSTPINLKVSNVIHFAGWVPGQANTVAYSTVEPRATAPGWQANNDLYTVTFSPSGVVVKPKMIVEANTGGIYSWWGTTFAWSPDGSQLAYIRPDGVGFVELESGSLTPWLDITPLNTHGDWAWIPSLAWGADGETLFLVTHAPPTGLVSPEESPFFDLIGLSLVNPANVRLAQQAGMFAYPAVSPLRMDGTEKAYRVAYLEAIFPTQSETSRYRLVVMDRDGSNRQRLFPAPGLTGLDPQTPLWAPEAIPGQGDFLAVLYQGNLWLVDAASGQAQQITGDGSLSRIDWK
ncbi:MAG: G5 domain-containing protein [Anaerolineales bacterium]|nr:G5 domain-containing protein [Anaerolineales bacterium]